MAEIVNATKFRIDKEYFKKLGEKVSKELGLPKKTEIDMIFVGDAEMRKLNKKYRGIDKTTDVLSFFYDEKDLLGELFISVPQAKKPAREKSYPLKRELSELFVHGILHLTGYEDEKEKDYRVMIKKQEEVLAVLNS